MRVMRVSGRSAWFGFVIVWAAEWATAAVTRSGVFIVVAGIMFTGLGTALATNWRGAARWFWLRFRSGRASWSGVGSLDLPTIGLVGRGCAALGVVMTVLGLVDLLR